MTNLLKIKVGDSFLIRGRAGQKPIPNRIYTVTNVVNPWAIRCSVSPPLQDGKKSTLVMESTLRRGERL